MKKVIKVDRGQGRGGGRDMHLAPPLQAGRTTRPDNLVIRWTVPSAARRWYATDDTRVNTGSYSTGTKKESRHPLRASGYKRQPEARFRYKNGAQITEQ